MEATSLKPVHRRPSSVTLNKLVEGPVAERPFLTRLESTLGLGLVGSFLMFVALPPLNVWPLAWIAPTPWLLLIRQPVLAGKRPYRSLWFAGFMLWLGAIHWLRLPHPLTHFGWLALAFYLALYLPVFVGLSRVAVHRLGISVVVAAPVVWTALELARGHLLSGFTMGNLSHTQVHWLAVIQGADVVGDYGVSGLVMLVAACIVRIIPWRGERGAVWALPLCAIVLGSAVAYGHWRMSGDYMRSGPTVALIQGSIDAELKADQAHLEAITDEYVKLSIKAIQSAPQLDLLVWPETMYRFTIREFDESFKPPDFWQSTPEELKKVSRKNLSDLQKIFGDAAKQNGGLPPPLLLGTDAQHFSNEKEDRFNSAQFVDSRGNPLARYDKMHPVMFGEYIPLAEYIPFLYKITPLTGGLTSGTKSVSQQFGDVRYAPNICYETVIPHLIRRQVVQLRKQNEEPDVLVNLTNDGWFRGSSELDMHLACGVFRAIEMRKPLVIAANTGFSASIDGDGRIVKQGARRAADVLIAEVKLDSRQSVYLRFGDWFSGICLAGCVGLAIVGIVGRRKTKTEPRPSGSG
jgi:apolipoprotein N-acyltransferase